LNYNWACNKIKGFKIVFDQLKTLAGWILRLLLAVENSEDDLKFFVRIGTLSLLENIKIISGF
jgi:hypothetical protein